MSDAAGPRDQDHPSIISRNARYGMVLFVVYLIIYSSFVALSVFAPDLMARQVFAGVNLAVMYGFGLIIIALVLAVFYMYLCRAGKEGGIR